MEAARAMWMRAYLFECFVRKEWAFFWREKLHITFKQMSILEVMGEA